MKRLLYGLVALCLLVGGVGEVKGQASYVYSTFDVPGSNPGTTAAYGINDAGQIVGAYNQTPAQVPPNVAQVNSHGFLLSAGTYTTLDVPGAAGTTAQGINSLGQIVGMSTHGSYLLSGGSYTTLNVNVPGQSVALPNGINDLGQIVGSIPSTKNSGFLLSGGHYTELDVIGSGGTDATGINNAGQIVGKYDDLRGGLYGFLLSGGIYTTLNAILPWGINDAGDIVGGDVLLSDGRATTINVPGSIKTFATGLNNAGDIVGWYYDTTGYHGFLATPTQAPVPEPSTLLLLAIGTLGVIGWVWRRRRYGTKAV